MKILLFSQAPAVSGAYIGGVTIWCQSFVRMMRNRGHRVFIVTFGKEKDIMKCKEFSEDLLFVKSNNKLSRLDYALFGFIPTIVKAARQACKIIESENGVDAIIVTGIHEASGFIFNRLKSPLFIANHGCYPYELRLKFGGKKSFLTLFIFWILEQIGKKISSGIVFPSEWLRRRLKKRLDGSKLYIITNALKERPTIDRNYTREMLGLRLGSPLIVSSNRMKTSYNKEAFKIYLNVIRNIISARDDIQFLLTGVVDNELPLVKATVRDLPVCVIKNDNNIFEYLKLADMFLHISLIDTFSLITLEAMSLGLPVVTTNVGALPELIKDGKTGILCDLNVEDIAQKLLYIIKNDKKANILGKAAMDHANSGFYSEDNVAKIWDNFLIGEVSAFRN